MKLSNSFYFSSFFFILHGVLLGIAHAEFVEEPASPNTSVNLPTAAASSAFDASMTIITILFAFVFIISVMGFVIGGAKLIFAGGSEKALEGGRKLMLSSAVGLLSALLGYVIINIIKYFFK